MYASLISDAHASADTSEIIRYWGLASFYAYRAYHDDFLLNTAESLWNLTSAAFITADDARTFKQASRNVTIKPACDARKLFFRDRTPAMTLIDIHLLLSFDCGWCVLGTHMRAIDRELD